MEDTMEEENGREAKLKAEITRWLIFFGVAIMLSVMTWLGWSLTNRKNPITSFTTLVSDSSVAICIEGSSPKSLDIRTGQCGTVAPKSGSYQPADAQSLCELQRSLRRQARTLLRRAAEHLEAHAAEFPGYDPDNNILKRCTIDGNLIQTR